MHTTTKQESMENNFTKKKILYVDDDPQSRLLVKYLIGKHYNLTICNSAEEALQVLQHETFDLILLDIRLEGGMSGIELLAKIRTLPHHNETPVVAVTAFAFEEDKKYIMSSGFTDYIAKPINLEQFKHKVREYTENESVLT